METKNLPPLPWKTAQLSGKTVDLATLLRIIDGQLADYFISEGSVVECLMMGPTKHSHVTYNLAQKLKI